MASDGGSTLGRAVSITVESNLVKAARPDADAGSGLLLLAVMPCLALAVWARLHLGLGAELWFDEGGTGGFATQPSLADVTRLAHSDSNAPVYAYVMWFWVRLFGASNASLHLPSLIFSLSAPVIAWASLRRSRPAMALVWMALLAAWQPGIMMADFARCYALLVLVAVVATAAHRRVLARPSLGRAAAWAASASLTTLVHYHGGFLALTQGLVLVALHRRRCLALWPALLAFLPAAGWIAWHAPRLAAYARPDQAWYNLLTLADLPAVVRFLLGMPSLSLLAAAGVGYLAARRAAASPMSGGDRVDLCVGAAALAGALISVGLGFARPTFTMRYLAPFAPGLLALVASRLVRVCRARPGPLSLSIATLAIPLAAAVLPPSPQGTWVFGTETASAWLAEAKPPRLAYFWDNPSAAVIEAGQLDVMGGFFLRRAGLPVRVVPLHRDGRDDMNDALRDAAGPEGAVLWVYDTNLHGTTALSHPPRLAAAMPGHECRDFGTGAFGILACRATSPGAGGAIAR